MNKPLRIKPTTALFAMYSAIMLTTIFSIPHRSIEAFQHPSSQFATIPFQNYDAKPSEEFASISNVPLQLDHVKGWKRLWQSSEISANHEIALAGQALISPDQSAYVGMSDGVFYRLSGKGNLSWRFRPYTPGPALRFYAFLNRDILLLSASNGMVYKIAAASGKILASTKLGPAMSGEPKIIGHTLFAPLYWGERKSGFISALDPVTMRVVATSEWYPYEIRNLEQDRLHNLLVASGERSEYFSNLELTKILLRGLNANLENTLAFSPSKGAKLFISGDKLELKTALNGKTLWAVANSDSLDPKSNRISDDEQSATFINSKGSLDRIEFQTGQIQSRKLSPGDGSRFVQFESDLAMSIDQNGKLALWKASR